MGFWQDFMKEVLQVARAGRIVVAKDEGGNEYIYQSVNSAVASLNIAPTTIRRYAREGGKIMTRVGLVQIEIKDEEKI